jgi:phosphatidylserine/phosphatidylglycerophosphate/cardiolipin synthase-like enzyme
MDVYQKLEIKRKMLRKADLIYKNELEHTPFSSLSKFDVLFKPLINPEESLAVRIDLIRKAKRSIDMTAFIITNDEVGNLILSELKTAYSRGVTVRLLVDSLGSSITGGQKIYTK